MATACVRGSQQTTCIVRLLQTSSLPRREERTGLFDRLFGGTKSTAADEIAKQKPYASCILTGISHAF